jgi:hypothetical protein
MSTPDTFRHRIRERLVSLPSPDIGAPGPAHTSIAADGRRWAAAPVHSDESIRQNSGHGWADWIDLIEAGPGRDAGHTAIAAWVHAEHGVPAWWAQGVTVGYERIAGLRLPGQMPDGTFSVSRSRVAGLPATLLRAALQGDDARADLFAGLETVLRSKPASKALRFALSRHAEPLGSLLFSADPLPDGRLRLTVTHDKLPSFDAGELWKQYWTAWLAAVADAAGPGEGSGRRDR